jgi:hypothetical protein
MFEVMCLLFVIMLRYLLVSCLSAFYNDSDYFFRIIYLTDIL